MKAEVDSYSTNYTLDIMWGGALCVFICLYVTLLQ